MHLKLPVLTTSLFLLILLSGCSTTSSYDNDTSNKEVPNNRIQFSSLSELSYIAESKSYQISPHDLLEIKVFQADELSQEVRVNPSGYISLPLINKIKAAGLTQEGLQNTVTIALKKNYLQNPQVTIFIKEYTNQRVTVGGDVKAPAVLPIVGSMSILQAISQTGGLDELAKPTEVILFRKASTNQIKAYLLNLRDINKGIQQDPYLQNEDKVIVQRSGSRQWLKDIRINIPFIGASR